MNPSVLDMPPGLRLNPDRLLRFPYRGCFATELVVRLAENGAIDPTMALRLVGWQWPPYYHIFGEWRWLYIARRRVTGVTKIGLSAHPMERLKELRLFTGIRGNEEYDLVGAMPYCGTNHERQLYSLFEESRLAGKEWFRDTLATRVLCWTVAQQRSREHYDQRARALEVEQRSA